MTTSYIDQIDPYWFGRPAQEVRAAAAARLEQWAAVPTYSRYLWSDKGPVCRSADNRLLKPGLNNSGYPKVNLVRDDGKPVTVLMHQMVLLAHHPSFCGLVTFPKGLETRHNPMVGDKTFNAYPEGIWPGTKRQNAADKPEQEPLHPCKNAPACPNPVATPGRRCVDCVTLVGREAAELLRLGLPLQQVAERFGYTGPDWVYQLAVQYGGFEGTKAAARTQRPRLAQRLRLATRRGDTL